MKEGPTSRKAYKIFGANSNNMPAASNEEIKILKNYQEPYLTRVWYNYKQYAKLKKLDSKYNKNKLITKEYKQSDLDEIQRNYIRERNRIEKNRMHFLKKAMSFNKFVSGSSYAIVFNKKEKVILLTLVMNFDNKVNAGSIAKLKNTIEKYNVNGKFEKIFISVRKNKISDYNDYYSNLISFGDTLREINSLGIQIETIDMTYYQKQTAIEKSWFEGINANEIILPEVVKKIEANAFFNCGSLLKLNFSKQLKIIGQAAFQNCSKLCKIELGENVNSIENYAFLNCNDLIEIDLSKTRIKKVSAGMLCGCDNLKLVKLPPSIDTIEEDAFKNCYNLEVVEFAKGTRLLEIKKEAFYNCSSLNEIELPQTLKNIEDGAFSYSGIEQLDISKSQIKNIGKNVFYKCKKLQKINLPDSLEKISENLFYGCKELKTFSVPNNSKLIEDYAFTDCTSLKYVFIPNSIQEIGCGAFEWCDEIEQIMGMTGIKSLGIRAFEGCSNLAEINVPKNSKIGKQAFDFCDKLKNIQFI